MPGIAEKLDFKKGTLVEVCQRNIERNDVFKTLKIDVCFIVSLMLISAQVLVYINGTRQ